MIISVTIQQAHTQRVSDAFTYMFGKPATVPLIEEWIKGRIKQAVMAYESDLRESAAVAELGALEL